MSSRLRNANLDVLRCLTMFAIVLCHVYQHNTTIVPTTPVRDLLFLLLISWHVDVFLSLSGWFGMKFSIRKFVRLWGVVAFYSLISILIGRFVLGVKTPIKVDGGWFGNTYLCLMLVVPFINAAIENLVLKGPRVAWSAWAGFAAMMSINWASHNFYLGIGAWDVVSHSLIQMVFVYFTVRLVRLTDVVELVKRWHIGLAIGVFVAGCLIFGRTRTDYIAPYTVAMAVSLLVLFERFVHFPQWVSKFCMWAAPSMFGVYLLHETSSFGRMFHRFPLDFLVSKGMIPSLALFCAAIACFLTCLILDNLRRRVAGCFKVLLFSRQPKNT